MSTRPPLSPLPPDQEAEVLRRYIDLDQSLSVISFAMSLSAVRITAALKKNGIKLKSGRDAMAARNRPRYTYFLGSRKQHTDRTADEDSVPDSTQSAQP